MSHKHKRVGYRSILLVDDNAAVRQSLREWLSRIFPQCAFWEAASGEQALILVQQQKPQVIVMDIGLPQMNGIQATRLIKQCLPQAQVVMLSIHEDARYQEDAALAGATGFVSKRMMHVDLLPVITRCIAEATHAERRKQERASSKVKMG